MHLGCLSGAQAPNWNIAMSSLASVRPFEPADHEAVNALHRAVGWSPRSHGGWRWLAENPARGAAPAGWVVDGPDGGPGAFLGLHVQRLVRGRDALDLATGFSLIVDPRLKGAARGLIEAVIAQPGLAGVFTLNANPLSAPIYPRFGFRPFEGALDRTKLSWTLNPAACLQGRVLRLAAERWPSPFRDDREWLADPRLGRPAPFRLPAGVTALTDLSDGSAYGGFWRALASEGRWLADRAPAALRWRLSDPDLSRRPVMLGAWRDGALAGVALALVSKLRPIDPAILEILDIQALEAADPGVTPELMAGLRAFGEAHGAAKMRLPVVGDRLMSRLGDWAGRARREGGWGHAQHRLAQGAETLARDWEPTAFDGDYSFCLRPAPVPLGRATAPYPIQASARARKA